jgi:hypothetical protein
MHITNRGVERFMLFPLFSLILEVSKYLNRRLGKLPKLV